jgi:hypothetical protein
LNKPAKHGSKDDSLGMPASELILTPLSLLEGKVKGTLTPPQFSRG